MIGIDIVEVERFEKHSKDDIFVQKHFNLSEVAYLSQKGVGFHQSLAGLFACKEAVLKALKIGIGKQLQLKDIEVLHDQNGAPYVLINDKIKKILKSINKTEINVSISHSNKIAISICEII